MRGFVPMTLFDKICAALSIAVGAVFMVLGVGGLFTGAKAHFTLPPILGALPFFLGWGMCVPLVWYWKMSSRAATIRWARRPDQPDIEPLSTFDSEVNP